MWRSSAPGCRGRSHLGRRRFGLERRGRGLATVAEVLGSVEREGGLVVDEGREGSRGTYVTSLMHSGKPHIIIRHFGARHRAREVHTPVDSPLQITRIPLREITEAQQSVPEIAEEVEVQIVVGALAERGLVFDFDRPIHRRGPGVVHIEVDALGVEGDSGGVVFFVHYSHLGVKG